jgi:RNA polymerase sigma-70 factor (ECF subfamily)
MAQGRALSHVPDGQLAQRILDAHTGSTQAEEAELCARFAPRIRLYGLRHLRSAHAADDLVQRVLIVTLEKLRAGEVREPARIDSFVFGTARMLARDLNRRSQREEPLEQEPDTAHVPLTQFTAEREEHLEGERLTRCLEALLERERAITVLTFFRGLASLTIAQELQTSEGNVRVMRHRALQKLRRCLGAMEEVA